MVGECLITFVVAVHLGVGLGLLVGFRGAFYVSRTVSFLLAMLGPNCIRAYPFLCGEAG